MEPREAQKQAHIQAERIGYKAGPFLSQTFSSIKFNINRAQFVDQEAIAHQNLALDPQSCLGRVAVVAAIMEKCHPKEILMLGEVLDDYFRNILLQNLRSNSALADDPSFMQELLMYEEPHAVVMVGDVQFEPLSLEFGEFVEHPVIEAFPLWEALAASVTVSQAWLEVESSRKLKLLEKAEEICPGLILIRENMAAVHELFGNQSQAIECVSWCLKKRPCARTLLAMYLLSFDNNFYDRLVEAYTEKIFDHILGGDDNE